MNFNIINMLKNRMRGDYSFAADWRAEKAKPNYDVIIIGSGVHGLACAYYLAKEHGVRNIAVVMKGKVHAGHERGIMNLCHTPEEFDFYARKGNIIRSQGDDALLCDYGMVRDMMPDLNFGHARFPIYGGLWQKTFDLSLGREARGLGIDLIEDCDVTAMIKDNAAIKGVETSRGVIMADKIAIADAGYSAKLAQMAGFELPLASKVLHVLESEVVKPLLNSVVTFGMEKFYVSQSSDGVVKLCGETDDLETVAKEVLPALSNLSFEKRTQEMIEIGFDQTPIMEETAIKGLFVNIGWNDNCRATAMHSGAQFAQMIMGDKK